MTLYGYIRVIVSLWQYFILFRALILFTATEYLSPTSSLSLNRVVSKIFSHYSTSVFSVIAVIVQKRFSMFCIHIYFLNCFNYWF